MPSANILGHIAGKSMNIRARDINKSDHAPQRIIGSYGASSDISQSCACSMSRDSRLGIKNGNGTPV